VSLKDTERFVKGEADLVFGLNMMLMTLVLDLLLTPIFVSTLVKQIVSLSLIKHTDEI